MSEHIKRMKKLTADFAFRCLSWWQRCSAADYTVHHSVCWSTKGWAWVARCEDFCEHRLAGVGGGAGCSRTCSHILPGGAQTPGLIHGPFQFCLGSYCLETEKIPQNLVSLRKLKSLCVTTGPDVAPAWADFLRGPQCRARPPICPLVLAVTVLMPVTVPSYILTGLP